MRRSKYGYLLLALLVITGLAGTITSTTISGKERKIAASSLKDTKNDVLTTVKDLSRAQLEFKAGRGQCSIREYINHVATSERYLWELFQAALKQAPNPEQRSEIKWTDEQLAGVVEQRDCKVIPYTGERSMPYKSVDEVIETFKADLNNHIKYIKGTTEDLRNHVVNTPFGWVDCYQICLLISSHSERHMEQIAEIKANPKFPSR